MPITLTIHEIHEALSQVDPVGGIMRDMEEGFRAYSRGEVVVPPVGELVFDEPRGDTHIKYGYIRGDDYYVVKIASGFYDNPKLGLPASTGLMLLFSQKTGELICIFLDEGHLTQVRTAAAGAVAGRVFAPAKVGRVGVFGAGIQARMQVEYLRYVREFGEVTVWGVSEEELERYRTDMAPKGFRVLTTQDPEEIASTCNVIITATPSCKPLLQARQIRKGTHITAMGSDTPEKQELDAAILAKADRVVVDSISQSLLRGEASQALRAGAIRQEKLVELGAALSAKNLQRQSDEEITVVDLTGVAVQDIQICKAVWRVVRSAGAGR
ncbi:MAG: ornithine cyclodeaminase family protein [Acidobacteriota bacterium]